MPFTKVRTSMTQKGVDKPIKAVIFQGADSGFYVELDGGPFNGSEFTPVDLANLIMMLDDLRTNMQEVADAAKF